MFLKKLETEPLYYSDTSVLGIASKDFISHYRAPCTSMFIDDLLKMEST